MRINGLTEGTPSDNDFFPFDGSGGTHKVSLEDLRQLVSGYTNWGMIRGTLTEQPDLASALNSRMGTGDTVSDSEIDEIINS